MTPKPLGFTRIFLSTCYTSLCDSSRCNTYGLYKGPLIKCRRLVKCRWCLTSAPWTSSTSSSSTSHLHNQHGTFNSNSISLRHKHRLEILFIHINKCICIVLAFTGNARRSILHLKHCFQLNLIFENFIFENFYIRKFCLILIDFILFLFNLIFFFSENFVMSSVHEPGSRTMSKKLLRNNTESIRIENRPSAPTAQPVASPRAPCAPVAPLLRPAAPCRTLPRACRALAARCRARPSRLPPARPARLPPERLARLPPLAPRAPRVLREPRTPAACAPHSPSCLRAQPRERLLPSPCCIATQLPVLRHRQPCLLPQYSRLYCDTTLPPAAPSSHNTKHCIAIQFHAVQSLAIQILQYNPSLHKPQSQYKILYCNTNSPQISLSLQYKNCIAIQFFFSLQFFFSSPLSCNTIARLAIQIHNTIGQ